VEQNKNLQVVDLEVSKQKFEQETSELIQNATLQRSRGIIFLECQFPNIKLAFCAPQLKPIPIVFAVNINFSNYDLEPLSLKFIHPLTYKTLTIQELGNPFGRNISTEPGKVEIQPLALGLADQTAFICLPGIREYHEHSDHGNDPWLDHRGKGGEGTLGYVIDKLYQFGISAISHLSVQINIVNAAIGLDGKKIPV
jgi:hypothetical protein